MGKTLRRHRQQTWEVTQSDHFVLYRWGNGRPGKWNDLPTITHFVVLGLGRELCLSIRLCFDDSMRYNDMWKDFGCCHAQGKLELLFVWLINKMLSWNICCIHPSRFASVCGDWPSAWWLLVSGLARATRAGMSGSWQPRTSNHGEQLERFQCLGCAWGQLLFQRHLV